MSKTRKAPLIDAKALAKPSNAEHFLRGRIKQLESENWRLRGKVGEQKVFAQLTAEAIVASDPPPPTKYTHVAKKTTAVTPVIKFADWHIGEVIRASETEGLGRYNFARAQELAFQITDDFLKWVEMHRLMFPIEECCIFCEGDYISGDIHEELRVTNEFPVPVQTAKAGLLMADVVRLISGHFKSVRVFQVAADNHGRLVKKPQAKQKSTNNMNHLVYTVCNTRLERLTNVHFIGSEGAKILADVQGKKFLIEHGDAVRAWSGIPIYGMERHIAREARRRMRTSHGFDYWSISHWHVPSIIQWTTIVNGSLSGTSEFDHIQGRHAYPSQLAFFVHPRHGMFNPTAFNGKP